MPKKQYSIDQLAAATARQAQSEAAGIARDLKNLQDKLTGLAIHDPTIRNLRPRTKKTTSKSVLGEIGGFALSEIISGGTSSAQGMGNLLAEMTLGQRIR